MASLRCNRRRLAGHSGSQLVEMAVVLPLLLILIAGMVDFAFLLHSFAVVTNAAREGARIGVLPGYNTTDIQNRVVTYVSSAGLTGAPTTTVTPTTIAPGGGGPPFPAVSVSVSYTHQYFFIGPMVTLIGTTFPASKTMTSVSVMRLEVAP